MTDREKMPQRLIPIENVCTQNKSEKRERRRNKYIQCKNEGRCEWVDVTLGRELNRCLVV